MRRLMLSMWTVSIATAQPIATADLGLHVGDQATVCVKVADEYTATDSGGTRALIDASVRETDDAETALQVELANADGDDITQSSGGSRPLP